MKVLDLNAYGVSEMNQQELTKTNGGLGPGGWLIIGLLAGSALDRNFGGHFMDGFNTARN